MQRPRSLQVLQKENFREVFVDLDPNKEKEKVSIKATNNSL